ncbi:hypothetical protein [Parablautia muri]|uniref:Uncharacterized protein n=1 Tax=Parablautia muri TaxID=2320879 RepID=A0A9X5BKG8_9FIRM|nr:hypothetical protein [Parablautia muri]NBJ94657.1 hypothetical protein [Parablautia muri]
MGIKGASPDIRLVNDFLAGLPMTIVASVFLLLDLVLYLAEEFGGEAVSITILPFDPACMMVMKHFRCIGFMIKSINV